MLDAGTINRLRLEQSKAADQPDRSVKVGMGHTKTIGNIRPIADVPYFQ